MADKPDYASAISRATEKLRKKPLSGRTSTYVEGSIRQTQGSYAEVEAQRWLQAELTRAGCGWHVVMWQEAKKELFGLGPFDTGGAWEPIRNSQNGDLYVYSVPPGPETLWTKPDPRLLFSIEVKSTERYRNVTITWSELVHSSARYLLAVTSDSTWVCTMEEARKHAIEREKHSGGSYYLIPHDKVKRLDIKEIIDGEERPTHDTVTQTGRDDIPF